MPSKQRSTRLFTRSRHNPILKPDPEHDWESWKLYNPGAVYKDGIHHLFYRAVGNGGEWTSSLGHAVSEGGEIFTRDDEPVLTGTGAYEFRGMEDPRITFVNGKYFLVYAAYDGITPRLSLATSKNLSNWEKHGAILSNWQFEEAGGVCTVFVNGKPQRKPEPNEWSKSGAIFPRLFNKKYLMLFGEHRIWFAESRDGLKWKGEKLPFLTPRSGNYFDNTFVEMGPPPIETKQGWLILYHGIDHTHTYRLGLLLLDLDDPRKILYRSKEPVFEPEQDYEMSGVVDVLPGGLEALHKMSPKKLRDYLSEAVKQGTMPRVVFCCGYTLVNDKLRIFYGAGDSVIATATTSLQDLLATAR